MAVVGTEQRLHGAVARFRFLDELERGERHVPFQPPTQGVGQVRHFLVAGGTAGGPIPHLTGAVSRLTMLAQMHLQQRTIHVGQGSVAHGFIPSSRGGTAAFSTRSYRRSFADSNGDGIGDLAGLRGRLDYLHWLGVDGIWINPTFPSPNRDWGYDVSDYFGVHPDLGTIEDLDALIAAAAELGIRILLDLVPAHTSDQHEWFLQSRSSKESPRRPLYIWRDEPEEQEASSVAQRGPTTSRRASTTTTSFCPSSPI